QRYDAATQHHLYVKLERPQFYALFGDFDTGLTQTELARYSRSLSGFKSEYGGEKFSYKAFAANTSQRFVRDEIQGDGTSGLYRLSGQHIVINSEKIAIETRDRFHSQEVVETHSLLRHIDYDIDYTNGTLFFREPIFSRDTDLNPVFIVADYEVQEGGVEVKVKLLPDTQLRLEAAGSDGELADIDRRGGAYLAEIEHFGEHFDSI